MNTSTPTLRLVRETEEPLGLFFRPGKDDHKVLQQLLSEGQVGMQGVVFDPTHSSFQENLRKELNHRSLDSILDPGVMELATPVGHASRRQLPWAAASPHIPSDFSAGTIDLVTEEVAKFVGEKNFNAVVAPAHYLGRGISDAWLPIDLKSVTRLREILDARGLKQVSIHYPLAISSQSILEPGTPTRLKAILSGVPIDSIWLRIHPFGSDSGDTSLRRYISFCRELHGIGVPVVAEKTGVLGLALLAFGAVSGVESGIASGERFDFGRYMRPRKPGNKFGKTARVYIPDFGLFLPRREAEELFKLRGLRQYSCLNTQCCAHGVESMIKDSRRHFAFRRMGEIAQLSRHTPSLRPMGYLEDILRPATDNLSHILGHGQLSDELREKLGKSRKRQDGWRATLGQLSRIPIQSFSAPIERRIHRAAAQATA